MNTQQESIVVKATSTSEFFGEPSLIRVILEKMVPNMLSQPDREIMFVHRKVDEQATSIAIEIHAPGSENARVVIEHYLASLMENEKLTYTVIFTELDENNVVSFEQIIASTEAAAALKRHIDAISNSITSAPKSTTPYEDPDYAEMLWDELMRLPHPSHNMSAPDYQRAQFVTDELMGIVSRELGLE